MFLRNRIMLLSVLAPAEAAGASGGSGGGQGTGDGGGSNGGQGSGQNQGNAGGGGGGNAPWYATFKNPDTKGYLETKGFQDAEALADSYRNLEKIKGVPIERLLTLPTDDTPEAWNPIYTKLGRPEKADQYELETPQDAPQEFGPEMAKKFHELGLSKKQGQGLAKWWTDLAKNAKAAEGQTTQEAREAQITNLKKEWAAAYQQNLDAAGTLAMKAGITNEQAEKIRGAIGVDGFAKLMHGIIQKFGIQLGESEFHGGGGAPNFNVLSPAAAKAKREELLADPDFKAKYLNGGKKEIAQISRLYELEEAPAA
jgi:hypothetical protein